MHVKANMDVDLSSGWLTSHVIPFAGNFVLLFMMVSAFSVSCGYFDRIRNGAILPNDFYKKRYIRILPFFALLVMIDVVQTFISEGFSLTSPMKAELTEAYADMTLAYGLMPDAHIAVIGVGWFLGVIFLFYMLFPFFTFLLHTRRRGWIALALSIGLYYAVQQYFIPVKGTAGGHSNMLLCMPYFILGGMIYLYRKGIAALSGKRILGLSAKVWLTLAALSYTFAFFAFSLNRMSDLCSLILYALWLTCAVAESSSCHKATLLSNRITKFLSGISMEIYLCHMMFFRIVEKAHLERHINNDDWNYWLTCLLVLIGAAAFSLAWKWAEKKFCNINMSWLSPRQH